MTDKRSLKVFLTGAAMGAADVVPGVSGGTIAFVAGIYEELLASIKSISFDSLKLLKAEGLASFWEFINGRFLLTLGLGIATSLFTLAHLVTYLLDTYPIALWSFFFGLIVASAITIGARVRRYQLSTVFSFLLGTSAAYCLTSLSPVHIEPSNTTIFFAGLIAICAMILPGISGSFLLLMMGMYVPILTALKELDIPIILVFSTGCALGILSFSRVLTWMFRHAHDMTVALLTGFMAGSLNKVWPWKIDLQHILDRHGKLVPVVQRNTMPLSFEQATGLPSYLTLAGLCCAAGIGLIYLVERAGREDDMSFENSARS